MKKEQSKEKEHLKDKEKLILEFWEKNKIYEKLKKKNEKGEKFYFMDGPPYANGKIHLGTALNKVLKDISMRSHRMLGHNVFDRPGYDTHGVPIELQIEKELGFTSKKDIEKFGVDKFIKKCKSFSLQYLQVMNEQFLNLGIWMDWKNPYITCSDDYIEAIWHTFKEADKKGLLYLGKYPVHVCSRCETAVAYNEIEYEKQKDNSIFVKFPLKKMKKTFLIIWTTTPWTLPGNTGVMVNPEIEYQEVETSEGEVWIIAKELVKKFFSMLGKEFTIKKEMKGKELEGIEYESPLSKNISLKIKNGYKVVLSARYVTTEEGTGLVHCAPGHGKEDYEVGKAYGLDSLSPVSISGFLTEEAGKYSGKKAREVDKEIIEDLKNDGFLVHQLKYEHDYPLCWRDKTPLLMISLPQWFLKISEIHKRLLEENEKNNWIPSWVKLRMKAWLEGISDWPISRQRYWGTPLPIWYDELTGEKIVIGSIEELRKLSGSKKIEVHKPWIDSITIKTKSGKILKRIPEVLDVWFDSGVSSWAALGYPSKKKLFEKFWPADLNIEGKDQIRGWWNSQLILSTITFNKKPFNNILLHGMVLDIGKNKMSKSLGNFVTPESLIEKYGRDYLRYYFAKVSKGDDFSFNEKEFSEIQRVFMLLSNLKNFTLQTEKTKEKSMPEDKWIISKYNSLLKKVEENYQKFNYPEIIQDIEKFLIQDFSRNYIQIIRERAGETYRILSEIYIGLLKILSPIIPFTTEIVWQELQDKNIVKEESIHLCEFPKISNKNINPDIEKEFEYSLKIIELGLAERDKLKIGLKWPLAKIIIYSKIEKPIIQFKEVIKSQLNVKEAIINSTKYNELKIELDTIITPELEAEGFAREIARKIQAERKNAGLTKKDIIELEISCDDDMRKIIEKNILFLKERINSSKIDFIDEKNLKNSIVFTAKERKISLFFRNSKGIRDKKI